MALVGVPHLRRLVPAAGEDASAVGAERHAVHRSRVSVEVEQFMARVGVPHLRRVVRLPVRMRRPSGLNATLTPRTCQSLCPLRMNSS